MRARPLVFGIASLGVLLSAPPPPAVAWDSYVHQALVQLADLSRLDTKILGFQRELVDGTDAPDRKEPFKPADHYSQARSRSIDAFNGALNAYLDAGLHEADGRDEEAREGYRQAASGLGSAIHYLEDLAAVGKTVDAPGILPGLGPKGRKEVVGELARQLVRRVVRETVAREVFQRSAVSCRETTFAKVRSFDEVLSRSQQRLGEYAERARKAFEAPGSGGWPPERRARERRRLQAEEPEREVADDELDGVIRDTELREVVGENLVLTVAGIERAIELFNEQARGYLVAFQVTIASVRPEYQVKRIRGESSEDLRRRRASAYAALPPSAFEFREIPLGKYPCVIRFAGPAVPRHPRDGFAEGARWATPVVQRRRKPDGSEVVFEGTVLLTSRQVYGTWEELVAGLSPGPEAKPSRVPLVRNETGVTEGSEGADRYRFGPLTAGWSEKDRAGAIRLLRSLSKQYDCFVAHAVYGDPAAPAVGVFRAFREEMLRPTALGRGLIRFYDRFGPGWARALRARPAVRPWARAGLDLLATLLDRDGLRGASEPFDLAPDLLDRVEGLLRGGGAAAGPPPLAWIVLRR